MGKRKNKSFAGMQLVTSCISTTLVLVVLGLVVFCVLTADRLSDSVRRQLSVTVLLTDEAGEADASRFEALLRTERFISGLTYIPKEQALKEHVEATGSDPSEFLGSNPFSASFELQMDAAYANTDSLCWITKKLKNNALVADVLYQKDLVESLNRNLQKVGFVLLVLAGLLTIVSFTLINNTVRLSIYSRRFLIHTMKLVGASWSFIRRPFLARCFWLGVVSAVLADALLLGGIHSLVRYDAAFAELITKEMMLMVAGVVLFCGLFITLVCSYFSVNAYLRMKESDMYEI